ncbi:MAG: PPC domain-containing protein [Planctomycetales bacterium]|nr:PPC domain-containing protein [Planctomycetales bacterium]
MSKVRISFCIVVALWGVAITFEPAIATDAPSTSYIFPPGGQRGKTVDVRIGAHYLHGGAPLRVVGNGVAASESIHEIERIWFEGPLIVKPDSQQSEDYPKDHAARFVIADDAPLGKCFWQVSTSQGAVESRPFVIGDLPEIVENEIDGAPLPTDVQLPITINGRIFPREDVDIWRFTATAGQIITCVVNAARIGSPLDARLEIRDPDGQRVVENDDFFAADSMVRFRAEADGNYEVRIHDINFGGLQNYVYRLTILSGPYVDFLFPLGGQQNTLTTFQAFGAGLSGEILQITLGSADDSQLRTAVLNKESLNPISIATSRAREIVEGTETATIRLTEAVVLNGRIAKAGDVDRWLLEAAAGTRVSFSLKAASLGSALDARIIVRDCKDDSNLLDIGSTKLNRIEPTGEFTVPDSGKVELLVSHFDETQLANGNYAYRLALEPNPVPDFALTFATDAITLFCGETTKLKVFANRFGGNDKPIQLQVTGLANGVSVDNCLMAGDKSEVELTLRAANDARIDAVPIRIEGVSVDAAADTSSAATDDVASERELLPRVATMPLRLGGARRDEILLGVSIKTPFKIVGDQYRIEYAHRGTVHRRPFLIDRKGYSGPLTISLTDKQTRHLQGVEAVSDVRVPEGKTEFEFPIRIPTWLEQNRTGRIVVKAVGEITDDEGRTHKVSYSSNNPNDQIIILTSPTRTGVEVTPSFVEAKPNSTTILNVTINRGQVARRPVKIELLLPKHFGGIKAPPAVIPEDAETVQLEINVGSPHGPFNMPMTLRAITHDATGDPVVAECEIEVVPTSHTN